MNGLFIQKGPDDTWRKIDLLGAVSAIFVRKVSTELDKYLFK